MTNIISDKLIQANEIIIKEISLKNDMAISKDAKLMLNFLNRTTLTLGNEENRLSERASRAITELMGEKLVLAQKADDLRAASMSYSLTEKGQKSKLLDPRFIFENDGEFPLTTPNT